MRVVLASRKLDQHVHVRVAAPTTKGLGASRACLACLTSGARERSLRPLQHTRAHPAQPVGTPPPGVEPQKPVGLEEPVVDQVQACARGVDRAEDLRA